MTNRIITKINDIHEKYFNNYNFNYLFLFLFFMMILYYIIYLDAYKEGYTTSSECLEAQGDTIPENAFKSPDDVGKQLTIKQLRDKRVVLFNRNNYDVKWCDQTGGDLIQVGNIPFNSVYKIKSVNTNVVTIIKYEDAIDDINAERWHFKNFPKNQNPSKKATRSPYIKAYNDIENNRKLIKHYEADIIKYKLDKGAIDLYFKPIIGSDAVECTINPKLSGRPEDYEIKYEDEDGLIHQFNNSDSNRLKDFQGTIIYKKTYIDDGRTCNKDYNEMQIKNAILDDKIRNTTNKLYKAKQELTASLEALYKKDNITGGCVLDINSTSGEFDTAKSMYGASSSLHDSSNIYKHDERKKKFTQEVQRIKNESYKGGFGETIGDFAKDAASLFGAESMLPTTSLDMIYDIMSKYSIKHLNALMKGINSSHSNDDNLNYDTIEASMKEALTELHGVIGFNGIFIEFEPSYQGGKENKKEDFIKSGSIKDINISNVWNTLTDSFKAKILTNEGIKGIINGNFLYDSSWAGNRPYEYDGKSIALNNEEKIKMQEFLNTDTTMNLSKGSSSPPTWVYKSYSDSDVLQKRYNNTTDDMKKIDNNKNFSSEKNDPNGISLGGYDYKDGTQKRHDDQYKHYGFNNIKYDLFYNGVIRDNYKSDLQKNINTITEMITETQEEIEKIDETDPNAVFKKSVLDSKKIELEANKTNLDACYTEVKDMSTEQIRTQLKSEIGDVYDKCNKATETRKRSNIEPLPPMNF